MRFKHLMAGSALCLLLFAFQSPVLAAPEAEGETTAEATSAAETASAAGNSNETIAEGVYAGEVYIGGMTGTEAAAAIDSYYQEVGSSPFTVTVDTQTVSTTLAELGLSWDSQGALEEAESLGKSGPVLQRYKTLMDLKYGNVTLEVSHTLDQELVSSFVSEEVAALDQDPVNATITRRNGEFEVTADATGLATDQEATTNAILTAVQDNLTSNMQVAATVTVTEPTRTYEALVQINDRLGSYSTDYSDSSSGRKNNIEVATERLNGKVLMPGESLSVSDTILPREPENGYQTATQYSEGETVEAYGGGVCQVSSTLYNALLWSELRVTERAPHSMVVTYVPYAFDAAIAAGVKDLVFENNLEHPIYIAASADGSTLTFAIYGVEYRPDNREIDFEATTVSEEYVDPQVVYDDTMYVGQETTTGSNKPAVVAYLEKIVYEDGVEVSRTKLHTDSYSASRRVTTIGTKPLDESQPADATVAPSDGAAESTSAATEQPSSSGESQAAENSNEGQVAQ